jgi:succinyl-CoA synthetase beta subunit
VIEACGQIDVRVPLVVRLSGTNEEEGRRILQEAGIEPGDNGWEAAQKIVEMAA